MRKYLSIVVIFSLIASLSLVACNKKNKDSNEKTNEKLKIYYVNDSLDKLLCEDFETKNTTTSAIISDILDKMKDGGFKDAKNPTIPNEIQRTSFNTEKNVLGIVFDENYYDIEGELLRRAAIVLTLCQLDDVDYVEFYINNEPLIIDHKSIGAMSSETFVNDVGKDADYKKKVNVSLFFADSSGESLVKQEQTIEYDGMKSLEECVLLRLIVGPDDNEKSVIRTINSDVGINRVTVNNSRCYVDFDDKFLTKCNGVSEETVIYSIVNTLTELSTVNEVMITVNGDIKEYYQNKVRLDSFLSKKYDLNKTTE